MAKKQNFYEPSRRRLEFDEPDCGFVSMKTPMRTADTGSVARNRLPLTPVNYAEAHAKPRPQFMPGSAMNPPSRLPVCSGLKHKPDQLKRQPTENATACRNMKFKAAMDSAKVQSAARKPQLTKGIASERAMGPLPTTSVLSTAKRVEVHAKPLDSAARKHGGTRLFAPPQTGSVMASAKIVNGSNQASVGAPLMRFGSVSCMSRIPLPKATPSASTANIYTRPVSPKSAAKNGSSSPPNRAVSMHDLTMVAQEPEPLVPVRRNLNMKGLLMAASASTLCIDKLIDIETPVSHGPNLAADTSISLPNGLNDEVLEMETQPTMKPPRCSISMTNLIRFSTAECETNVREHDKANTLVAELLGTGTLASTTKQSNLLFCDTKKDPLTPSPTPELSPTPSVPASKENVSDSNVAQLQLDLARCRDELTHCQSDLSSAQRTVTERDARVRELELTMVVLEEYNENCKALISEEETKAKEAIAEASRIATELHILRADRARLESEVACERDATCQVDEAKQEAANLRRELASLSQRHDLLTLESTRLAAAKDEVISNERNTITALRGELESARRGATAKFAELRAEVEGELAARNAVRFELEKLQIAFGAACADRDTAIASSALQSQELAEAKRRISALSVRNDDELQRTLVVLRGDVERLTRENASLNELVNDRVESITSEFDTLMRTIASSNEERALLERSTFAPDRTLNASVMLNASIMSTSRYPRSSSSSCATITFEKLERLVAEQFASQKQIADRDCTIGRLRDQLKTAEFARDKVMRELRSLEKLLIRIFRRLQHNADSMNDECKQLISELSTLLRDRGDREDPVGKKEGR